MLSDKEAEFTQLIKSFVENKMKNKEKWENEFGGFFITNQYKTCYDTIDDVNVVFKYNDSNVVFKILPKEFSLSSWPSSYWGSIDGFIENGEVTFS